MSGWVRVSRSIFTHEMFAGDPFSRRDAWLWLIAHAAWKNTKHRVGNEVHDVPRGSLFCTLRELAREWRWGSDYKVRDFLRILEDQRMISRNSTCGKTHITICNYSDYQDFSQEKNAQKTQAQRTENALKEQNKQKNKDITRTEISENWEPTPAFISLATERGLSLRAAHVEAVKFHTYHFEKGTKFKNWELAFKNWVIKAIEFKPELKNGDRPAGYGFG